MMTAKPTGVLSLVNEEVIVPNGSDASLLSKMQQQHRAVAEFKALPRSQGDGFIVQHYAGPVGYLIDGFVDKNRDAMPGDLMQAVSGAKLPLLRLLFRDKITEADTPSTPRARGGGGGARGRSGGAGKRTAALAAQFADSLDALLIMLQATTPHFVRCVKPNADLVPNKLDGAYVMRQLREMGMVHVVRARKQGFAHRYPFGHFLSRYAHLLKGRDVDPAMCVSAYAQHLGSGSPPPGERTDCVTLLAVMVADAVLDADGWAVGTGKVFLKEAQQQQLEVAREAYLIKVVTEELHAAIAARDIPKLESAIAQAVEVQLQSPVVAEAQQLLALLQAQLLATVKLQEALAARDMGLIDAALGAAAKVGLASDLVHQVVTLKAQLTAQLAATAKLTAALQANSQVALVEALAEAGRVGLNTGLVKEAQRRLDGLQKQAELDAQITRAVRHLIPRHLDVCWRPWACPPPLLAFPWQP